MNVLDVSQYALAVLFLNCILVGLLFGIWLDVLYVITSALGCRMIKWGNGRTLPGIGHISQKGAKAPAKIILHFLDAISWVVYASLLLVVFYVLNDGVVRPFGIVLALLSSLAVHKLTRGCLMPMLDILSYGIRVCLLYILYPLRLAVGMICRVYKGFCGYINRKYLDFYLKKQIKRAKALAQNGMLVYNIHTKQGKVKRDVGRKKA